MSMKLDTETASDKERKIDRKLNKELKDLLREARHVSQEKLKFYESFLGKGRNRSTMTISRSLGKLKAQGVQLGSPRDGFRNGIDLASPAQQQQLLTLNSQEMKRAIANSSGPSPTPKIQYHKKATKQPVVVPDVILSKTFGNRVNSTIENQQRKLAVNFDIQTNIMVQHPPTTVNSRPQT